MRALGLLVALLLAAASVHGSLTAVEQLTRPDMRRALDLARWPHTDAERARFHERYRIPIEGRPVEYVRVEDVEVITEFRRLALIAEDHMRLGDLFGRAILRDAEEALRPWRGKVAIAARLRFDLSQYIPGVPAVDVAMDDGRIRSVSISRSGIYGEGDGVLTGARIEALFDASAVERSLHTVVIRWKDAELGRGFTNVAHLE